MTAFAPKGAVAALAREYFEEGIGEAGQTGLCPHRAQHLVQEPDRSICHTPVATNAGKSRWEHRGPGATRLNWAGQATDTWEVMLGHAGRSTLGEKRSWQRNTIC